MLDSQKTYLSNLSKLVTLNCSTEAKKQLLAGFIDELKFKISTQPPEDPKRIKTMTTEEGTIYSETSIDISQAISDLEKKIILKRDMKIELHEEIEEVEEELEAIERTVYVKQEMDDDIKRQIDKKMFMIEMGDYECRQKEKEKETKKISKNKTFSNFSRKVFDFFN